MNKVGGRIMSSAYFLPSLMLHHAGLRRLVGGGSLNLRLGLGCKIGEAGRGYPIGKRKRRGIKKGSLHLQTGRCDNFRGDH